MSIVNRSVQLGLGWLSCLLLATATTLAGCNDEPAPLADHFDLITAGGTVYDGSGSEPVTADLAIRDDRIAAIDKKLGTATETIDASGMAVAPGFINMPSWADESLIEDGRSLSNISQGVTLEVFGEGWSMGPLNDDLKAGILAQQGDIRFDIESTSNRPRWASTWNFSSTRASL